MYVRGGARFWRMVWLDRRAIAVLLAIAVVTELAYPIVADLELFSVVYVGIFSTALSIFLVFRFNEAYDRWWEARKLWGSLVNVSRDFARQALTLLPQSQVAAVGPLLVRRQIAFVHMLRIHLREGGSAAGRAEMERELERILPEEAAQWTARHHVPNALLQAQSETLAGALRGSTEEHVVWTRFDANLGGLFDVLGACERIKNTVFPDPVSMLTRVLVWSLAVLLLIVTVGPDGRGGFLANIFGCFLALGYLWIDAMGRMLKDPFETRPNDIPMSALSTTIERDLREMMGEEELPEPVQPVNGVLM